jgi:putative restriction endonuclease
LFQRDVRAAYGRRCALCGQGLITPSDFPEVEAAPIVPRKERGTNDPRNGVCLCRSHHWALDRHLWSINRDYRIIVPSRVGAIEENAPPRVFSDRLLRLADNQEIRPAIPAIEYHLDKTFAAWGQR